MTKVAFEHRSRHWRLIHNPFPATLHPGSCLDVVIRYKATQCEPAPCELVIERDDPQHPRREVEVIAWTLCCCKKCCTECRCGCECGEHHRECCQDHHRECCGEHEKRKEHGEGHGEHHHGEHHHEEHHHGEHAEADEDDE